MITHKELERFGLSEKEAKVYLAAIELGPSTAADIAKKSKVNRATTYAEIEAMIKVGLMSISRKNKTTLFVAEHPSVFERMLKRKEERLKLNTLALDELLPALVKMHEFADERPKVQYFEGKEGLLEIQKDFLKTKYKKIEEIYSVDDFNSAFESEYISNMEKVMEKIRKQKKIKVRALYVRKKGRFSAMPSYSEMRIIPYEKFPVHSDILIYGNKTALISLKGKLIGVIIDHKDITTTLRSIFNLAWSAAKKYQ